jgi:outer membrane protein assembly factor BamE (lipoprotein component of BamABCDE complex)
MSKKRWCAIAALFVLAAVLALVIMLLLPPTPGVTYANYSRIEKGMTHDDVVALLGSTSMEGVEFRPMLMWQAPDHNEIWIDFDRDGRVVRSVWNGIAEERSALERLRDRLPFVARKPPPPMFDVF